MQASKPYNKEHAEALLLPCDEGSHWGIDERGVWPPVMDYGEGKRLGLLSEYKVLSWKPVMAFQDDQNAPDCKDTPALPFPFDARDLAAFMLDGVGAFVADYYGDWEDGPETECLNDIDPSNNYARRAVREAFDAYRMAIEKVGKYDMDALARRDAAHTAYWKSSNDKALLKAFEDAEAEWDAAYQAWLTKMVRCLLEPQAAAPAPVADESESNAPLQKAKAKRRTWKDVSASYIVEVMRAGRYTTAKELYRALESKAGANSPFDKGTGDNRGSLFVRDIAESLSLKTVQNNWQSLREQAKK